MATQSTRSRNLEQLKKIEDAMKLGEYLTALIQSKVCKQGSTLRFYNIKELIQKVIDDIQPENRPIPLQSVVCSKSLFDVFLSLKDDIQPENRPIPLQSEELKTYKDFKMAAKSYQTAWQQLLRVYGTWEYKPPGYLDFT